ncbi:MAG: DEAD/DEAH box helicase [bacterium]|nr:DEAD/DEAH box helicase [bacterium]
MNFDSFNFENDLQEGLQAMGFEEATPIQEQAIPIIMEGSDLIGCAQTGTGKTAAFVLPVLNQISKDHDDKVRALIIAPTRELVLQIDQQIEGFSYFTNASSVAVYGGGDGVVWAQQKKAIEQGVDIVVATPGRLIALLNSESVNLDKLKYLILDEADRMLDMGFADDIMRIVNQLPEKRQNILFSATMPPKIRKFAGELLHKPKEVTIAISKPAEGISQKAFLTYDEQKLPLLEWFLKSGKYGTAIIFASTKENVRKLFKSLKGLEINVEAFHSGLDQKEREAIMQAFKAKRVDVIIGTDILSRGIDVEGINLVVNYDVPPDPEDYVHRIGRTARADTTGEAITFINKDDQQKFSRIEKLIEREIMKTKSLPARLGEGPDYAPRTFKSGGKKPRRNFKPKKKNR